ncbi:MAG: cysteine peptidase family C39 domain-containing protein [Patescibacteria group bacterium]
MQPPRHYRQTPGLCGPSSLRILFSYYGKELTEQELTELCEATPEYGADHTSLLKTAQKLGFSAQSRSGASLSDIEALLAKDTPVLVGWWSQDDDHYSIVYAVDGEYVHLVDPQEDEPTSKITRQEFEKVWYDLDGPERQRTERWMMWSEKTITN